MGTVKVGLNGIDELDFPTGVSSATVTAPGKVTVNLTAGGGGSYTAGAGISITNNVITNTSPNVQSDWSAQSGLAHILNQPTLATVATTGSYTDLTNKPTIPAAQVNSDWTASSGAAQILNKPPLTYDGVSTSTITGNLVH